MNNDTILLITGTCAFISIIACTVWIYIDNVPKATLYMSISIFCQINYYYYKDKGDKN